MSDMRFTKDHEWIKIEGDTGTVGISDYAQHALGDVVFVEVPEPGRLLAKGDEVAVVESVKAASEVYSPVSGTVIKGNAAIVNQPGLVNEAAEAFCADRAIAGCPARAASVASCSSRCVNSTLVPPAPASSKTRCA